LQALEHLANEPNCEQLKLDPLDSATCPNLKTLHVDSWAFDLERELSQLERLETLAPLPEWIASSATLREVVVHEQEASRSLEIALAAPRLEVLDGSVWNTPLRVPDVFAGAKALRRFALAGTFEDPVRAYAAVAEAPQLAELRLFCCPLPALPPALAERPLRKFDFYKSGKGERSLDLGAAFDVLAKTPLRELRLNGVKDIPPEIAGLAALERLEIGDFVAPRFPAEIGQLSRLGVIRASSADIVGPARKKLEKALPGCAIIGALR
jgi:hypothetical protein